MDRNFDLRAAVCQVSQRNAEMVHLAREVGVSAKFTGSGGAIIGTYTDQDSFNRLQCHLSADGIEVLRPRIVTPTSEP